MVVSMVSLPSLARCRQPSLVSNAGVAADPRLFLGGSGSVARVTTVSFRSIQSRSGVYINTTLCKAILDKLLGNHLEVRVRKS